MFLHKHKLECTIHLVAGEAPKQPVNTSETATCKGTLGQQSAEDACEAAVDHFPKRLKALPINGPKSFSFGWGLLQSRAPVHIEPTPSLQPVTSCPPRMPDGPEPSPMLCRLPFSSSKQGQQVAARASRKADLTNLIGDRSQHEAVKQLRASEGVKTACPSGVRTPFAAGKLSKGHLLAHPPSLQRQSGRPELFPKAKMEASSLKIQEGLGCGGKIIQMADIEPEEVPQTTVLPADVTAQFGKDYNGKPV